MRALQLIGDIGLDHLQVVDLPDPKPGPREVLIRVKAVSLNYRDLLMINGVYGRATPLPLTPFSDGCGVIEAVGAEVTKFAVGDRVSTLFFQNWLSGKPTTEGLSSALGMPIPGAGRELAVFAETGVSKVPDFLDDHQVSTLACAALTAWRALFEDARLQPGDTVLLARHRWRLDLRPAIRQGRRLPHHHHLLLRREAGTGQGARRRPRHQLSDDPGLGEARRGRSLADAASISSWRSAAAAR